MPYAVELLFDSKSEKIIYDIWKEIYEKGWCSYLIESDSKPHITLAIYNKVNLEEFEKRLQDCYKDTPSFKLVLSSIGIFPQNLGTVFIAPAASSQLQEVHQKLYETFQDYRDQEYAYYRPGLWAPHCTISMDTDHETAIQIINHISKKFQSVEIKVTSIVIVKFRPVNHVLQFDLKKDEQ
jgi:2'-5' RNA ligase